MAWSFDDAISATKAAVAEGTVPGGGLSLLRRTEAVRSVEADCEGDERTSVQILRRALAAPTRQIAENSAVDGGVVVEKLLTGDGAIGFDASCNQYVDVNEAGMHLVRRSMALSGAGSCPCGFPEGS
jgi:chaperonin GroEL